MTRQSSSGRERREYAPDETGVARDQRPARRQLERQSVKLSTALSLVSLTLPALTAVGWMFDIPLLTRGHPMLPAMQPNTAVGLAIAAAAVLLTPEHVIFRRRTWMAVLLASVILIFGLVTLGEYAFGWDSDIDRIFVHAPASPSQPFPGRPSPQTSLSFALLGLVLLSFNLGIGTSSVGQIGAIVTAANAIVISTSEMFGASSVYGFPIYVPAIGMALHTAIAFIFLVVALFCRRPNEGMMTLVTNDTHSGEMARRILVAVMVAPPAIGMVTHAGVVWGWYNLRAQVSLFALMMAGFILGTTWRAAKRAEHEELQARGGFEALRRVNAQLNQAIREREVFAALVENSPDFIGIADTEGTPVYLNPAGRRMVGLSTDFALERTVIPDYYTTEQREFASAVIVTSMREQGHWEGETAFRHWQTDQAIPVSDTHFMIRHSATGEALGMGTITRDISDAKRAQREIEAANRKLVEANNEITRLYEKTKELDELRTNFFANVSHEFRTPLSLILGPVEKHLASAAKLGPDLRRDLGVVERSARTLLHYVDDLLDVARLDAGRLKPEYAQTDAADIVRVIGDHFSALAKEKSIEFSVDAPRALPFETDVNKFQRVLLNLLSNAFKFTPNGGRVRLSLSDRQASIRVEIADSGPGIPEHRRAEVFERFRQFDRGNTAGSSGTGLGLSIVRDFAVLLGGGISVAEAPEGGALFLLDLPSVAPVGTPVEPQAPEERDMPELKQSAQELLGLSPAAATDTAGVDRQALVLVVEDNREMRRFVAESLNADGFVVMTAADGREGYERAIELKPDVVVTDIMMPNMSGDELVRRLRARTDSASMPIVVLTARSDRDFRIKLLGGGADDYLDKPFSREELCVRVRNLATRKRAEERSNDLRRQVEDVARASKSVADAVASLPESSVLAVLQTIALKVSTLTSAEYGAVGIGTDPNLPFQTWAVAGMSHEQAEKIGGYPHPRGVLGLVTKLDRAIRLRDVRQHPEFRGFPPNHPLMTSFMGISIRYKGNAVGNLYVANKRGAVEFTDRDRELIEMLADHVGVAIETARLYSTEGMERAWLEAVVDQMPEGVLLMDAEGRLTVSNRFMRSLAPVERQQRDRFGNAVPFDLWHPSGELVSPDDLPIVKALTDKVTTEGRELVARRADGRLVPVLVSAAPIRGMTGQLAGATMILQDASTLKELGNLREEWATIVAHDLQQPVHTILLRSDLLLSGPLTREQADSVRQVRVAVNHLGRMISDLMEASNVETHRVQISFDGLDLGELVRDIVTRIPDAASRIDVRTPARQHLFINGDAERLEQVVTNLLSNAVKYGASGARIRLEAVADGEFAKVSVTNSGPGIAAEDLPFVFERYARSRTARTSAVKGLGLGLYIAKGLVEAHGGRIWVESVPEKTTTFHFTVPLHGPPIASSSLPLQSRHRSNTSIAELKP